MDLSSTLLMLTPWTQHSTNAASSHSCPIFSTSYLLPVFTIHFVGDHLKPHFCHSHNTPERSHLEFIHLLFIVSQLFQQPRQLALFFHTLFRPTDRLVHPRRAADEELKVFVLWLGKDSFQKLLGHMSTSLLPAFWGFVEEIEGFEAVGVGVF